MSRPAPGAHLKLPRSRAHRAPSSGRATLVALALGAVVGALGALAGCEAFVQFDRDKIGATGAAGGTGGTGGTGGSGGTGGCSVADDCAALSQPCAPAGCEAGSCVVVPAVIGTEVGASDGDCVKLLCDGTAPGTAIVDDADIPDDLNPCTTDTCSAGVDKHEPLPIGAACGLDLVCDDLGKCGECNAAADCGVGKIAPPCKAFTCDAHVCGTVPLADGTPLPPAYQTAGDCSELLCQGGTPDATQDDLDVPDDFNDCTDDACSDGVPSTLNAAAGAPCGGTDQLLCDGAGACIGCTIADDCAVNVACAHPTCAAGKCGVTFEGAGVAVLPGNQIPGDCAELFCDGDGHAVPEADDLDVPDAADCMSASCQNGAPVTAPLAAGAVCNGDRACDGAGACLGGACLTPTDCPGAAACVDGVCCGDKCTGTCSACSIAKKGGGLGGECGLISAGQDPDAECPGAEVCSGDAADLCGLPLGAACAGNGACVSGFCADGVCCQSACGGVCVWCSDPATSGQCTPIPAGTDPQNDCNGNKKCNGAGACQ